MANYGGYGYQYETSPKKLQPEYVPTKKAKKKTNVQLKVSIENSLNLSSIEKAAQDKLGMQKLDNSNKIYLDLQKKDYVEPASEEVILNDNSSWFEKLIKKLTQIIK